MRNQITELTWDAERSGARVIFSVVQVQCRQGQLVGWLVRSSDSIAKGGVVVRKS